MQRFNAARAQELRSEVREDLADPALSLEGSGSRRIEWFSRDWLVWWNYAWTAYRDNPHPGVSVSGQVFDLRTGAEVDLLQAWFEDSRELDLVLAQALRHPPPRPSRRKALAISSSKFQTLRFTRAARAAGRSCTSASTPSLRRPVPMSCCCQRGEAWPCEPGAGPSLCAPAAGRIWPSSHGLVCGPS
jgi:hypothetical protein